MGFHLSSGFLRALRKGSSKQESDAESKAGTASARREAGSAAGPRTVAEPRSVEAAELASAAPAPPPPVLVPRWVQLVLLPLALLGLWALAGAAGVVVLILIAASTLALILNPLVKMISRGRVPRGLAILLVYVAGFAALGGIGVLLANPVSTQVN